MLLLAIAVGVTSLKVCAHPGEVLSERLAALKSSFPKAIFRSKRDADGNVQVTVLILGDAGSAETLGDSVLIVSAKGYPERVSSEFALTGAGAPSDMMSRLIGPAAERDLSIAIDVPATYPPDDGTENLQGARFYFTRGEFVPYARGVRVDGSDPFASAKQGPFLGTDWRKLISDRGLLPRETADSPRYYVSRSVPMEKLADGHWYALPAVISDNGVDVRPIHSLLFEHVNGKTAFLGTGLERGCAFAVARFDKGDVVVRCYNAGPDDPLRGLGSIVTDVRYTLRDGKLVRAGETSVPDAR